MADLRVGGVAREGVVAKLQQRMFHCHVSVAWRFFWSRRVTFLRKKFEHLKTQI